MNILYLLFDATSLAIMAPTFVLLGLIVAAAHKKRCLQWQSGDMLVPRPTAPNGIKRALWAEMAISLAWLALSTCMLNLCLSHLFWGFLDPSASWLGQLLITQLINTTMSVLLTLPLFWFIQLRFFQRSTRKDLKAIFFSSQFIFAVSLLTWAMVVSLPVVQFLLVGPSLSTEHAWSIRELWRACIALSTIPSTAAGLAIAFHGATRNTKEGVNASKFLNGSEFRPHA